MAQLQPAIQFGGRAGNGRFTLQLPERGGAVARYDGKHFTQDAGAGAVSGTGKIHLTREGSSRGEWDPWR